MGVLAAQARQFLQDEQVGKTVKGCLGDELLAFPASRLRVFDFEQPANFFTGISAKGFALGSGRKMLRGFSPHRLIIPPRVSEGAGKGSRTPPGRRGWLRARF